MAQRIRNYLKATGVVIGLLGLVAGFGNLLGLFAHAERLEMVRLVRTQASIPSTTSGFTALVAAFPPPEGVRIADIASMGPSTHIASGGYITPTGPLVYYNAQRQHTPPIATFDELQAWASSTPYPWVAWVFSGVGWLLTALGIVGDFMQSKRDTVARGA
jgi:hypothetical protein